MTRPDPFDTPFFREQRTKDDEFFREARAMQRGLFRAAWPVIALVMLFNLAVVAGVIWLIVWIVQQFT